MSQNQAAADAAKQPVRGMALYRLVWKWHFIASLYVLPFMFILSITGGMYLYKPQVEEWMYKDRLNVEVTGEAVSIAQQIDAVEAAVGMNRLRTVTDPQNPARSTLIEFDDGEKVQSLAWVNPYTGEVLGITAKSDTFMEMVKDFHGELLGGKFGTKFVELAAQWAIVMIVTGAVLWWPRGKRTVKEAVSLPKSTGRAWWRETHMFTGMLAVVLITPLLLSGLPWTDVWGGTLGYVQSQTGQKSQSLRFGGKMPGSTLSEGQAIAFEDVILIAQEQGLVGPYEMRPPKDTNGAYWMRSTSVNRHDQDELVIEQYSGEVLKRIDFENNPVVAKTVSYGVSLHKGELFGTLNLAINTLAALLGALLSLSGFVAWWKRRPVGKLGVPNAPDARLSKAVIITIVVLAVLLPMMGVTLLLAMLLDWLVFRRIGWFQSPSAGQPAE